jgi:ADP-ribosylglycohydrolase
MLKEIAIADAYGAGFEFSSAKKVKMYNDLSTYCTHDLYGFSAKYTDDTQMTIAIAELLLTDGEYSVEVIANKFVECFKRDKRRGYSRGFYELLTNVESGTELLSRIIPNSERNGAAMRSVPLGFLKDKIQLLKLAAMQAKITHNTEIAIKSSCAIALTSYFAIQKKGKLSELRLYLENEGYGDWNFDWRGEVSVAAYDTVSAVFSCLLSNDNIKELLVNCVDLCGDTDSVASIAVGLACCFDEYESNIPSHLFLGLDEAQYGICFLDELEEKLNIKFR